MDLVHRILQAPEGSEAYIGNLLKKAEQLSQAPEAVRAVSLPASHSVMLPSKKVAPWGQAQLYPLGLRRQRWLQTFLQRLGTEKQMREPRLGSEAEMINPTKDIPIH